jgi:signal transduction histidine kinase
VIRLHNRCEAITVAEALTNVAKRSDAKKAEVTVRAGRER